MEVNEGKAKFVKTGIIMFNKKHRVGLHSWVKRSQKQDLKWRRATWNLSPILIHHKCKKQNDVEQRRDMIRDF